MTNEMVFFYIISHRTNQNRFNYMKWITFIYQKKEKNNKKTRINKLRLADT